MDKLKIELDVIDLQQMAMSQLDLIEALNNVLKKLVLRVMELEMRNIPSMIVPVPDDIEVAAATYAHEQQGFKHKEEMDSDIYHAHLGGFIAGWKSGRAK